MVAIFDLAFPVISDSAENMDDMSSELNDLENLEAAIEMLTIHCPQVNVQCTSDLAAAMLDLSLPVTSDSNDSMTDMSTEFNDLENIGVVFGI